MLHCVRVQASIDKQARKLDDLKAAPHAPGAAGKAAKQKKVDKLDRAIKTQMAKELGSVKMKQALVVGALATPCPSTQPLPWRVLSCMSVRLRS